MSYLGDVLDRCVGRGKTLATLLRVVQGSAAVSPAVLVAIGGLAHKLLGGCGWPLGADDWASRLLRAGLHVVLCSLQGAAANLAGHPILRLLAPPPLPALTHRQGRPR